MTFLLGGLTFHFMAQIFPNIGHLGSRYILIPWKPKTIKAESSPGIVEYKTLTTLATKYKRFFWMANSAGAILGMVKNMTLSKDVGDLQLGDKMVTLNQLVCIYIYDIVIYSIIVCTL